MSAFFEIAFAAATGSLCLFTGTGFSKAVSDNIAPGWQELLENICALTPDAAGFKGALFPEKGKSPLSLEEAAQIIALELAKIGRDLHEEIAANIRLLMPLGNNSVIVDFLRNHPLQIVTTNYDRLAEDLCKAGRFQSISPGFPIPRAPADIKIYHVHGSIDSPKNMVVTADDYFKFMHGESYFSRKLSTVLHENTVVILGYSLSDTNLKTILNDYAGFSRNHVIGGSVFFVSRSEVDQYVKDYYAHCYGIRVLDGISVHGFFQRVTALMPNVSNEYSSAIAATRSVLFKGHNFHEDYLKTENSFLEITASVAALGRSIDDPSVVKVLGEVIKKKRIFAGQTGAWSQYDHLAVWLCHLGSILDLTKTSIRDSYLTAVRRSMESMSSRSELGYSWHAYDSWDKLWKNILAPNRQMIAAHIRNQAARDDALEIVGRG